MPLNNFLCFDCTNRATRICEEGSQVWRKCQGCGHVGWFDSLGYQEKVVDSVADFMEIYEPAANLNIYVEEEGVVIATPSDQLIVAIKFPFTVNEYLNIVQNSIQKSKGGDA